MNKSTQSVIILLSFMAIIISINNFIIQADDEHDLVIINGLIIDGSGASSYNADVAINNDRIVKIGDISSNRAKIVIDASGLIITPGFIDPHTHAVRGIYDVPTADSSIMQGVTTLTDGNDGTSPYPINEHYQKIIDTKISVNWSVFVGQGTIRRQVMGLENRSPTEEELKKMKLMVAESMEQGALGLSTGLFYVPGNFSTTEEIIELAKIASEYGGIYISHMREEAADTLKSIDETINIGIEANIPVQITHHKIIGKDNWGMSDKSLSLIDDAIEQGVKVSLDQYPYTASQTSIKALIPQWAQEGGNKELIKRIDDPAIRPILIQGIVDKILYDRGGGSSKNVFISKNTWDTSMEGKNLSTLTIERGMDPTPENAAEVVFEIIKGGGATAVYHAISSKDVDKIMQHPMTSIGSDGPLTVFNVGAPHPRTYGTFARVLGYYVRERNILSLEEAIRKMTSLTAASLNIQDRGLIREGYYADIAIFDKDKIIDKATFENPHQYAEGMQYVLVNGVVVLDKGTHTNKKPGRILYGPGYKD